jgi:XTP/dITP diphosphohydrolase
MHKSSNLKILLGTHNEGKAVEISSVLGELGIYFSTLRAFSEIEAVEESGTTYEENAILKAQGYARQTGYWTLADDSGLEVDALDGAPGVLSARYAGAGASDSQRIERLLSQLEGVSTERRTARFVCVLALADAEARVIRVERGVCEGTVIESARGSNGFGYDPIFVPHGFTNSFAELPSETKDTISHRGRALQAMRRFFGAIRSLNLTHSDANS